MSLSALAALLVRAIKIRPRVFKLEFMLVVSLSLLCPPHSELESLSEHCCCADVYPPSVRSCWHLFLLHSFFFFACVYKEGVLYAVNIVMFLLLYSSSCCVIGCWSVLVSKVSTQQLSAHAHSWEHSIHSSLSRSIYNDQEAKQLDRASWPPSRRTPPHTCRQTPGLTLSRRTPLPC